MVFVDGRELYLRGEVEPGAGQGDDVRRLENLPGVRSVTNQLEVVPRPSPRLVIHWDGEKAGLTGNLTGSDLDRVVIGVREGLPPVGIRDRIRIDDRLGHPLWLGRLEAMLSSLSELRQFTFFAWRDRILVDGVADSTEQIDRVRYRAPAGLDPEVEMTFRLRPAVSEDTAMLSLLSGWNGSAFSMVAARAGTIEAVRRSVKQHLALGDDARMSARLDAHRQPPAWFDTLEEILPALNQVHDLYLTSAGDGFALWGRVDDAGTLGEIQSALVDQDLSDIVISGLEVSPAGRPAEISLFKDRSRAVVSGRLPNPQSLGLLMDTLEDGLDVTAIENFVTLEPNTEFSPWLSRWPVLLPVLPETPFGLTVSGNRALVSGETAVGDESHRTPWSRALESMLPGVELVDWLTIAADD